MACASDKSLSHNVTSHDIGWQWNSSTLVSFDLWGPSWVQSAGGKIYFMLIVDGGTSYKYGAYLQTLLLSLLSTSSGPPPSRYQDVIFTVFALTVLMICPHGRTTVNDMVLPMSLLHLIHLHRTVLLSVRSVQ